MPEDPEYIDVDAVIRMRKGERLADSKKTEGWSRGFTPKSTSLIWRDSESLMPPGP